MRACGERQAGVALITAILVAALAATVVASMIGRQQLDFRRTANLMEADQLRLYADGMAEWAARILQRDRERNETDHPNELWATVLPPIPVENGELAGRLADLQGRFNVNALVRGGEADAVAEARLRRLLSLLELNPELAAAVRDWVDPDIEPGYPNGAEDDRYLGRQPAYRTANGPMVSPSELALVQGFDDTGYRRLRPHITTLPGVAPINVNTAGPLVLMSLADGLTEADARRLTDDRGAEGYASVERFLAHEVFAGREIPEHGLSVSSHWFLATSDIRIGRLQQHRFALLHREDSGRTRVVMQALGSF